jgi:Uma2 family endonuclease
VISRAPRHRYSYPEYVTLEASSSVRHEFADGEIYALAGGTPIHAALAATIVRLVGAQLPPGCRVYSSDLRVRVPETGLSTYPDVTVVCGQTMRAVDDAVAVTNPVVVVESRAIQAKTTTAAKLSHYQRRERQEVLLVSHARRAPSPSAWIPGRWIPSAPSNRRSSSARSARLAVDDVYRWSGTPGRGARAAGISVS